MLNTGEMGEINTQEPGQCLGITGLLQEVTAFFFSSLEDCAEVTFLICQNLKSSHGKLVDIFFFGHSDLPLKRSLVDQRKNVNWFKNTVRL